MLCHPVFFPSDALENACSQEDHSRNKRYAKHAASLAASQSGETVETDGTISSSPVEPPQKLCKKDGDEIAAPLFAVTYTDKSKYGKKLWPKGKIVKVFFIEDHPKRADVLLIAGEWSKYCSIRFEEVSNRSLSEVRVTFDESAGSFSLVGTDAAKTTKDNRTMNLAVTDRSTVLHEFGHVLGLLHEHQSPLKGIVEWDEAKVLEKFRGPPNFWTDEDIKSQILDRYETDGVTGSTYDRWSIMHYSFSKELIKSIDGRAPLDSDIPVIKELSPTDKAVVKWFYGPPGTKPAPPKDDPRGSSRSGNETSQHGYTIAPGEEMRFNFTGDTSEPRKYTIETTGDQADLSLSLYGPDDEERFIAAATDGGEDGNPRVVQLLMPNKKYSVVIRAFGSGGTFDLRISTLVRKFASIHPS